MGGLQCILLEDKVAGIIGTGFIGRKTVEKIAGLVKKVVCYDAYPNQDWIKTVPNAEYVALDVFEGEKAFMFKDMSEKGFENHPELEELASMDNVIMSSHIAFYTDESVRQITEKTFENFEGFLKNDFDEKAFVA